MNTRMSRLTIAAGIASLALSAAAPAIAHDDDDYYGHEHGYFRHDRDVRPEWRYRDYAPRVVYSRPAVIYRPAPVYYAPPAPVAYAPVPVYPNWGAVGGAIAGAVIGSTIGHGDGRAAAIAAGSVMGAMIGASAGY